jgi:hypothetical protein
VRKTCLRLIDYSKAGNGQAAASFDKETSQTRDDCVAKYAPQPRAFAAQRVGILNFSIMHDCGE